MLVMLENKLGMDINVKTISRYPKSIVFEMLIKEAKIMLMERKKNLKGTNLWLDDDHTERELKVQAWIRKKVDELRKKGKWTKVSYQKYWIDNECWKWYELEREMRLFRNEQERN